MIFPAGVGVCDALDDWLWPKQCHFLHTLCSPNLFVLCCLGASFFWRPFLLRFPSLENQFFLASLWTSLSLGIVLFPRLLKETLTQKFVCLKQPPDWQTRTQIGIPCPWAGPRHHPRNFYLPFTSHGGETDPICPINRVTRMCSMEFYVKWTWDVKLKWREAVMMWSNWRCDMAMVWRFVKCWWCEVVIFMMIRKWCWKNIALHVRFFLWNFYFLIWGWLSKVGADMSIQDFQTWRFLEAWVQKFAGFSLCRGCVLSSQSACHITSLRLETPTLPGHLNFAQNNVSSRSMWAKKKFLNQK